MDNSRVLRVHDEATMAPHRVGRPIKSLARSRITINARALRKPNIMNFKEFESDRKLAGSYYTSDVVADFLARWVSEINPRSILEPGSGGGAFVDAVARTINGQGHSVRVDGVDIDQHACAQLVERYDAQPRGSISLSVHCRDFLEFSFSKLQSSELYDAVVGNPPYIRYQYLDGSFQDATKRVFDAVGLKFTRHTNAWVPFVIQSVRLLKPAGRMAMVVPAEIMHVLHAGELRRYLLSECEQVITIHLEELFSDEVLQGVVLLLCSKKTTPSKAPGRIAFPSAPLSSMLNGRYVEFFDGLHFMTGEYLEHKWMEGLLTDEEREVYSAAKKLSRVYRFDEVATVDVGVVTGANKFFLVPDEVVERYGLSEYAQPMFGRSSHVQGVVFTKEDLARNAGSGLPSNFLYFPPVDKRELSSGAQRYITIGEAQNLQKRYKCRIRKPWYTVPSVWASDIAMLKRAHTMPRLILNQAKALTTDTAYRISALGPIKPKVLVGCFVNSLTALSAELEGRHYGGGVIELVPSEIERLTVPVARYGDRNLKPLDELLRRGADIYTTMREQDTRILTDVGLSEQEIDVLNRAWRRLMHRRLRENSIDLNNEGASLCSAI